MIGQSIIDKDAKLEAKATTSYEELAKHRWHHTLDESNDHRYSIREYAKAVGRNERTIRGQVNGYRDWIADAAVSGRGLSETIERAKVGVQKEAVIEAIAEAEGIEFSTAKERHEEIREVRTVAEERAERKGTTVEEEIPAVAATRAKARKSAERTKKERAKRHTLRFLEMEGDLSAARARLRHALDVAIDVGLTEEETELLLDSLSLIKQVLNLLDLRLTGTMDIDWDKELSALTEGVK